MLLVVDVYLSAKARDIFIFGKYFLLFLQHSFVKGGRIPNTHSKTGVLGATSLKSGLNPDCNYYSSVGCCIENCLSQTTTPVARTNPEFPKCFSSRCFDSVSEQVCLDKAFSKRLGF